MAQFPTPSGLGSNFDPRAWTKAAVGRIRKKMAEKRKDDSDNIIITRNSLRGVYLVLMILIACFSLGAFFFATKREMHEKFDEFTRINEAQRERTIAQTAHNLKIEIEATEKVLSEKINRLDQKTDLMVKRQDEIKKDLADISRELRAGSPRGLGDGER